MVLALLLVTLISSPVFADVEPPVSPFSTSLLRPGVTGEAYLDPCRYLQYQWDTNRSAPGTVVVPIMFHSITQPGKTPQENTAITAEYFAEIIRHARELGFETITSGDLLRFLKYNESIPPRSMIFIVDDRRLGVVQEHFLPVLEANDWTVTLAYITGAATETEWTRMEELLKTNRLDVQAHGFLHNGSTYFTKWTPEDVIQQEIWKPISLIEQHTGERPLAFIWPGGNFTPRSIEVAHTAGYQLGFTAYSRGPLMFNWIPLGQPERDMQDPLMVLPRAWSTAAYVNLDEAVAISNQYIAFSASRKIQELLYYYTQCPAPLTTSSQFPTQKME